MNASDIVNVTLVLPNIGGDTNVWGAELNNALSLLQTTINELVSVLQDKEILINNLTAQIAALAGGVNLTLLTSDMLGVPGGIATLDNTGAVDVSQVAFR